MGHGVQSVMEHSLCQKDVLLAWSVVILNAGSVTMDGKIIVYGMVIVAVADVLTAVACWLLIFTL